MSLEKGLNGAFKLFDEVASGCQKTDKLREDVFREEFDNIVVDTCIAYDTDKWETGIKRNGESFVIVEQYESRKEAKEGHKKWVQAMKDNPEQELKDIDLWELGI